MARPTLASAASATSTETFSDSMSKLMIHSPSSDLTWKQKDTPAENSFDAASSASQHTSNQTPLTEYPKKPKRKGSQGFSKGSQGFCKVEAEEWKKSPHFKA